jgi:hypothetical protein
LYTRCSAQQFLIFVHAELSHHMGRLGDGASMTKKCSFPAVESV